MPLIVSEVTGCVTNISLSYMQDVKTGLFLINVMLPGSNRLAPRMHYSMVSGRTAQPAPGKADNIREVSICCKCIRGRLRAYQ